VKVAFVSLAAVLIAGLVSSEEDTRSLAERAAEAASRARRKPSSDKTLTNEDLKRAKGNVIFLSATPTTPPPVVAPSRDVPVVALGALSDQQVAGARLRGAIEEALRQLAESTPEQRAAIEQRVKNALDELARTHEAIGALTERARQGGTASSE
jgi:hypothetical protein